MPSARTLPDPFGAARLGRSVARATAAATGDLAIAALAATVRTTMAARVVRALVESPLGDVAAQAAVHAGLVERAADELLAAGVVERIADRALATPLPQHVADRLLAEGVAEQVAERVLAGPEFDRLVARVLEDPAMGRLVAQVLDSRLLDESVARVLASEELWLVVDEIARSPAVLSAISQQGVGFADQVVEEVGTRSRRADAWLERAAHRMLHRIVIRGDARRRAMSFAAPRSPGAIEVTPAAAETAPVAGVGYVGLVTRVLAFTVDAAVINVVAVLTAAAVGLALSVLSLPEQLRNVLVVAGGVAYVLWSIGYFVGFWATTGQTPGARLFRFQVRTDALEPLRPRRALLRFAALVLAALPCFAGLLLILVDDRRRGLQDMIARTVVIEARTGPATISAPAP